MQPPAPRRKWDLATLLKLFPRDAVDRLVLSGGLILIAIVFGPLSSQRWFWDDDALDKQCETVSATVTNAKRLYGKRNQRLGTQLAYRFVDANGATYTGTSNLEPDDERARVQELTVEYDKADPTRSRVAGTKMARHDPWVFALLVAIPLVSIFVFGIEVLRIRERRHLLAHGLSVNAIVDRIERWGSSKSRRKGERAHYRFIVNGVEYTGSVVARKAPTSSTTLRVLYDERRPQSNMAA